MRTTLKETRMRLLQNLVLRPTILACMLVASLAVNSAADAACLGASNTCFGTDVLVSNTTGINNTGIGYAALYRNTEGFHDTASGAYALYSNTIGVNNTASGAEALR